MWISKRAKRLAIALIGVLVVTGAVIVAPAAAQGIFEETMFDGEMIKAIRDGNNDRVEAAIVAGANVNDRSGDGSPAIVVAAESRNLGAIRLLVEAGARIDNRNRRDSKTALTVAAELGEASIVRALLELGADPDRTGIGSEPALIKAARNGHVAVLEALIEAGADLETTDLSGSTALEIAERYRHQQAANVLRAAGAY